MPAATQNQPHTPRVRNGEPQPALVGANEPVSAKRDLTSWWKTFSKRAVKKEEEHKQSEELDRKAGFHHKEEDITSEAWDVSESVRALKDEDLDYLLSGRATHSAGG